MPMPIHKRHCLHLADRIHALLVREIGQGVDRQRLLREPLYARDVLLVCDALRLSGLPAVAQQFRDALVALDGAEATVLRQGFGVSDFFNSLFDSVRGQPAPTIKTRRCAAKAAA